MAHGFATLTLTIFSAILSLYSFHFLKKVYRSKFTRYVLNGNWVLHLAFVGILFVFTLQSYDKTVKAVLTYVEYTILILNSIAVWKIFACHWTSNGINSELFFMLNFFEWVTAKKVEKTKVRK